MKNDFAKHLTAFLSNYLPAVKGFSHNTVSSYSDTFRLFLQFCQENRALSPEKMGISDMTAELVNAFLEWIEKEKRCSVSTRNQRLAALSSFCRYVQIYVPDHLEEIQKILAIPSKRVEQSEVKYISFDDMKIILGQPDCETKKGRRDQMMLLLLYDTGARVSELIGIRMRDIRIEKPAKIILHGKGSKQRSVPLMDDTIKCLSAYIEENHLMNAGTGMFFLFSNQNNRPFTRAGISYIINKYAKSARIQSQSIPEKITPHIFRHSKAMHLLQAGVNIIYIKEILGHTDVTTTQIYLKADLKMKAEALEKAKIQIQTEDSVPAWTEDKKLMDWLVTLGKNTR